MNTLNSNSPNLVNIISTWLKETKYGEHFELDGHDIANTKLDWIKCHCTRPGDLPPTPKYDIIICETFIDVWQIKGKQGFTIQASDPTFFDQLAGLLNNVH